jgi:Xaa-Pro dipeptidase
MINNLKLVVKVLVFIGKPAWLFFIFKNRYFIMDKRTFIKSSLVAIAGASIAPLSFAQKKPLDLPLNVKMDVTPISIAERQQRLAKALQLMAQENIVAIVLEPGAAMMYFTGISWWRSERLTTVVIPKEGDIEIVCPFFEEPSIRESLNLPAKLSVWQEHESPFSLVQNILKAKGLHKGRIGFESTVRYFVLDNVMSLLPDARHISADVITQGCRMIKSNHELALMHKANEVTLKSYEHVFSQLQLGMTQKDVKQLMNKTQSTIGGSDAWCLALFNEASAFPHGSKKEQVIKDGSVVLMDSGCSVHGYQSDISRTFVFGSATKKQRDIWNTVNKGQKIAFEQAKIGVAAGSVDDKVRAYYQTLGFGPEYKLPGLSHRTGHGIGMEGHESVNFVHGEKQVLQKGMCFSNEPGIYIPGEFGGSLEDCLYLGEKQAHWFTEPPTSLDEPLGKLAKLIL